MKEKNFSCFLNSVVGILSTHLRSCSRERIYLFILMYIATVTSVCPF
uniref:Uncharacterized protein n=1 Tax=Anguilla anguilla TaxID=7936 RepID=A0A0E9XND9_ANGAN